MLCDALLVNALTGVRITLLGWGETYRGNFQKLRGARSHVGALPPSDLVLFADAYDVLYAADATAIGERTPRSSPPASAGRGASPSWRARLLARLRDVALGREWCRRTSGPPAPTPYSIRWNSGVWLGRADDAHALLADLEAYTPGPTTSTLSVICLSTSPTALRSTTTRPSSSRCRVVAQGEARPPASPVVNPITRTHPLVVHFNGGAKRQFNSFRDALIAAAPRRCVAADDDARHGGRRSAAAGHRLRSNHALLRQQHVRRWLLARLVR